MALDPATADYLRRRAADGAPPLRELSPARARELDAQLREVYGAGPDVHEVTDHVLAVDDGQIRLRTLVPSAHPRGVLVYYHGGGWVLGEIEDFDAVGRLLARRTGCTVVLVEYRLAPEHPFPTAVEDAWTALQWVASHLNVPGTTPAPLMVAGDSAGGNLAAVVAHRATRAQAPRLSAQILIYPVTDCDLDTGSYTDPDNQLLLDRATMAWFWARYLPDPCARLDPEASPARAADLAGLPPTIVLTAEYDVLRDEAERYAALLEQAGVPVAVHRFAGQAHGFFTMIDLLPVSREAHELVAGEIDRLLGASVHSARWMPDRPSHPQTLRGVVE